MLAGAGKDEILVDRHFACFAVDVADQQVRRVERKRIRPEKLTVAAIDHEDAAAFTDHHRDVALFAAPHVGVDPLHELRIGTHGCAEQRPLVCVVFVPVVARQVLVVPRKLARRRIQRERRVAVQIGRCGKWNRVELAAVAFHSRVRRRVRDAPVDQLQDGIVVTRQSPRRRESFVFGRASPARAAGVVVSRRGVELPRLHASQRVVRRDVAVLPRRRARAAGEHVAFDDDGARRHAAVGLRFPTDFSRCGVERHDETVRRGVVDQVVIDGERLGARCERRVSLVFPDGVAVGRIQRDHGRARLHEIHHALIDDGDAFVIAVGQLLRPRRFQIRDVALVHELERREPLRVIRAAVHQPVFR